MNRTLLIMAGGTGGHVIPGLAVAAAMRARGWQVRWLGTTHGMENTLVPEAGLTIDTIAFAGVRGKGIAHAAKGIYQLIAGLVRCMRLIGPMRPNAVLGMGGYVTVPGGVSSALRGRPLYLMNTDAALLLSTRLLLPFARRVFFGLPGDAGRAGTKALWTGCPVRAEIAALPEPGARLTNRTGPLHLLVLGGSLGASVLNRVVPEALSRIAPERRPTVTHQAGREHANGVIVAYRSNGVAARVEAFISDMASCYADADVVLCRAGAMTVAELTAVGVASILVPFSASTTRHQESNARYLQEQGAALHLPQSAVSAEALARLLEGMTRDELLLMSIAARRLGRPEAAKAVADAIESGDGGCA